MPYWGSDKGGYPVGEPYLGEEPSPHAKRRPETTPTYVFAAPRVGYRMPKGETQGQEEA